MKYNVVLLITLFLVFSITVVTLRYLIPYLISKKIGQKILEIGPRWHKNKEGTPTMGGISFIIAVSVAFLIFSVVMIGKIETKSYLLALNIIVFATLNGLIGAIDDMAKMKKSQNKGLSAKGKFALQSLVAILFLVSLHFSIGINTVLFIPYVNYSVDIGFFYYVIAYFIICGIVNSVNLTDGIDGLASGTVFTVGVFFAVINIFQYNSSTISFFSGALLGASLGFLVYNFHPARVFMGDTGSLYLGALVVSMSFLIDNILLVLVYGFVFVCEAISDILQVFYFKITNGKRIFKMAPLHHHFEKNGWSEIKILIVFMMVNAAFCFFAYLGLNLL